MSTDRELLELAAKAAGIRLEWDGPPDKWQPMYYEGKTYHSFDPLTDDGDALRLAVTLRLAMYPPENWNEDGATVSTPGEDGFWHVEDPSGDAYADMRRAIVRAAAEIGEEAVNDTDRAIAEIRAALDLVPARSWWSVPFGDHAKYIEACSPPNLRALLDRLDERDAEVERLRGELNDCIGALPGSACYMDPPDGGSVTIAEQLRRMGEDAARYRWLRGGPGVPSWSERWPRWEVRNWNGRHWNTLFADQIDAAIDAARSKE